MASKPDLGSFGGAKRQVWGVLKAGGVDSFGMKFLLRPRDEPSAWCLTNHLALGQLATDAKSNEITVIPKLLKLLDIRDSVVTLDAERIPPPSRASHPWDLCPAWQACTM